MYIHRWAGLLHCAGVPSCVVQMEPFDVYWDANPEVYRGIVYTLAGVNPQLEDTLIIPEVLWGARLPEALSIVQRRLCLFQNPIWATPEYKNDSPETIVPSRFLYNHVTREHGASVPGIVSPYLDPHPWRPTAKQANRVLLLSRRNKHYKSLSDAIQAGGFPLTEVEHPVTQEELFRRLESAEYYVHSVYPEGFPMIALEAMRSGTIVVGTTGGGGNEFMFHQQTAMVVQDPRAGCYGDPAIFVDGIVDALNTLRSDPDLRSRLWTNAHSWSLQYTAERTTKQLNQLLETLMTNV